jgi:hypothetical protein
MALREGYRLRAKPSMAADDARPAAPARCAIRRPAPSFCLAPVRWPRKSARITAPATPPPATAAIEWSRIGLWAMAATPTGHSTSRIHISPCRRPNSGRGLRRRQVHLCRCQKATQSERQCESWQKRACLSSLEWHGGTRCTRFNCLVLALTVPYIRTHTLHSIAGPRLDKGAACLCRYPKPHALELVLGAACLGVV